MKFLSWKKISSVLVINRISWGQWQKSGCIHWQIWWGSGSQKEVVWVFFLLRFFLIGLSWYPPPPPGLDPPLNFAGWLYSFALVPCTLHWYPNRKSVAPVANFFGNKKKNILIIKGLLMKNKWEGIYKERKENDQSLSGYIDQCTDISHGRSWISQRGHQHQEGVLTYYLA